MTIDQALSSFCTLKVLFVLQVMYVFLKDKSCNRCSSCYIKCKLFSW